MNDLSSDEAEKPTGGRDQTKLIICCLVVMTLAVFGQAVTFDFVNFDDDLNVTANQRVLSGLTPGGVFWAFTTGHAAMWQPLVWLSFMADTEIGLGKPWAFHLTNVILHTANVVLLFLLLNAMTGAVWRSALVAALFAVHPLRAESVAWITERKDVLSGLFWLLTLLAYVRYTRTPSRRRYAQVAVAFALGLMAKATLITLPVVMLLLDLWPLRRTERLGLRKLIVEKIPLLAIAAASAVITIVVNRAGDAMASLSSLPIGVRVACALVDYVTYLKRTLWPAHLGFLYIHAGTSLRHWTVIGSALFLVLACVVALGSARRRPYVAVGWFWYLITLLPVIGLLQVGWLGIGDRFTYIPHIGLFIVVAWGVPAIAERCIQSCIARRAVLGALAMLVIVALAARAYVQVGCWKNSITLFEQALRVDGHNPYAELNLASALADVGRCDAAVRHCGNAIRIRPRYGAAQYLLGTLLANMARWREAEAHLRRAVELAPGDAQARNNLGAVLLAQQKPRLAIEQFKAALKIKPDYQGAQDNLDRARSMAGDE